MARPTRCHMNALVPLRSARSRTSVKRASDYRRCPEPVDGASAPVARQSDTEAVPGHAAHAAFAVNTTLQGPRHDGSRRAGTVSLSPRRPREPLRDPVSPSPRRPQPTKHTKKAAVKRLLVVRVQLRMARPSGFEPLTTRFERKCAASRVVTVLAADLVRKEPSGCAEIVGAGGIAGAPSVYTRSKWYQHAQSSVHEQEQPGGVDLAGVQTRERSGRNQPQRDVPVPAV